MILSMLETVREMALHRSAKLRAKNAVAVAEGRGNRRDMGVGRPDCGWTGVYSGMAG